MSGPRALVIDVRDVPLGAAERVVATVAAEAVLRGLGRAALAHPRAALVIESEDATATAALVAAAARLGATLAVRAPGETPHAERLRPSALAEARWREEGRPAHVIAIAGAVESPQVLLVAGDARVETLVARAVPRGRAWVALWGGAEGALVDRDATMAELALEGPRLLLALPAAHGLARRARTPLATWLRRAKSACASCALCTPACPESLPVHELVRALTAGGRRAPATSRIAAAVDCTGCGACAVACPQALAPSRVVTHVGARLRAGGVVAPVRKRRLVPRLPAALAAQRLGLARYATEIPAALNAL